MALKALSAVAGGKQDLSAFWPDPRLRTSRRPTKTSHRVDLIEIIVRSKVANAWVRFCKSQGGDFASFEKSTRKRLLIGWVALHDVPGPCSCPLNSSSTGFRSAGARVPVFERVEHRIRPRQQRSNAPQCDRTHAVPRVDLSGCSLRMRTSIRECKLLAMTASTRLFCLPPKSFCPTRQSGPVPLWRRLVGE
jgi:hypothetical protein